jgi:hypothetical protein
MKKGGGKSKGSAFEREVSRYLTRWLSGQEKEYFFYRSPGSGGVATVIQENKEITGDIIAVKPEAKFFTDKFSVELKTGYEGAGFHKHLKGLKSNEIEEFWSQAVTDADRAEKYPMLIFKKMRCSPVVAICDKALNSLTLSLLTTRETNPLSLMNCISLAWRHTDGIQAYPTAHFFDMEEFFASVAPDDVAGMEVERY